MSILATLTNIKLPYPTEGVIRTAQLDDTIAPQDSVQLAVNMNFDRVGAIQTRLGVTQYADDLVDAINNYGTLRNALLPAGYENLFQLGVDSELSALSFSDPSAVKISSTKIAVFWQGTSSHGFARNFEVDATTGIITALGTALEFEASANSENKAILVSSNRVLVTWTGPSGDGFVQTFNCASDSITANGTALEFDTANGQDFSLALIDSTHVICFYRSSSSDGVATVFAIDGGGTVTEPGSPLTFDSGSIQTNSCAALGNGTHFINFWGLTAKAQVFSVNTGTWAITALGSALSFDSAADQCNAISCEDGQHFVNLYISGDAGGVFFAQSFSVNLSTFAVTEVGTGVSLGAFGGNSLIGVGFGDGEHFVAFYSKNIGDGYAQMLEIAPVSFNISLVGDALAGFDLANNGYSSAISYSTNKLILVWGNTDAAEGKAAMFESLGDVVEGRWLYAGSGDEVYNTAPGDAGVWVSRRSGLAEVSKPRFSQYLNYIWMVNGNQQIGGDPVATSNGGNFGDDLVPEFFPPGDFIHAGFEGRVWVANKTLGVIYYTDIVQFIPPSTYELTYNPDVNFITQIAPQTGQSFTALFRVPRALLVFTQDNIYRIYGATSVDAYPAYDVGTFSQESIIQTKSGIFFHHSSGFYQFDYGSQPVEISRRIIDFVKAIPRSYYEDITGVYDGFDAVQWYVGPVTVEGITFVNCVLRYTISTQVWTVYDRVGIDVTAMIFYDDGINLNHLLGTEEGKTGAMDVGYTDFGEPFYYEYIDRWRAFTEMYYLQKSISEFSVYSENAAGANLMYQIQKFGPNAWLQIGAVGTDNNSIITNGTQRDFDVMRVRLAGNTKGAQVVVHGIEITTLTIKGQDEN